MKLTNSEAFSILEGLKSIAGKATEIPVEAAYSLVRTRHAIEQAVRPYVELRDQLIMKYSDGTGTLSMVDPHWPDFVSDNEKIASETIEVDVKKVKVADLGNLSLSLENMERLMPLVEPEQEDKK